MKKKQLIAMALVSAMSVSAAASMMPAKTYAATQSENEKLAKMIEDYKAKFAHNAKLVQRLEGYDTAKKLEDLSDAQYAELKAAVEELKVLLGKELGALKTDKSILEVYKEVKAKGNPIKYHSLIEYRKDELKKIKENQTNKVMIAEKKLKEAQDLFDAAIASKNFENISAKAAAVQTAQNELDMARADEVTAFDKLATDIAATEAFKYTVAAVDSIEEKVVDAIAVIDWKIDVAKKEKAYVDASAISAKYGSKENLEKAQDEADKPHEEYKKKVLEKINRQILDTADEIKPEDLNKFINDAKLSEGDKLDQKKKILIKNVLSEAEIKEYADKVKAYEELKAATFPTDLPGLATAYEEARESLNKWIKVLEEVTKVSRELVGNLQFVVDAKESAINYKSYDNHLKAKAVVAKKVNSAKAAHKEANDKLEEAKKQLETAKEELNKDPNSVVKQTVVKVKEDAFKAAQEKEKKTRDELMVVKADLERLENLSKELHKKFREYSEAVVKGAGNYEIKVLKEALEKSLEAYNEFAGEYNLPKVNINRAEQAAGSWVKVDGVWYYRDAKGMDVYKKAWGKINGVWYRFDEMGKMLSNRWFKEHDKWYWLKSSGAMASNEWVYENGQWFWAHTSGRIAENEWVWVEGKWYYAKSGGYLAMNAKLKINGTVYRFNKSGAWIG